MAEKVCLVSVSKEFLKNGIFQEPKRLKKEVPKTSKGKKQHLNNILTITLLLFISVKM